ncbi:acetylornithine deacetylase/succinyl-diaminopimelate desuccinylase-like protein [Sphingobacterium allocomposti]|uniref:Acetylornithine deacetylase/succinyl-diaminopimelate desuccinylase-like protein n=1 Tax=Sphingobacterium allocomposti TaxID=415956 RepID=A0A5S5DUD8_9SPHI|nr:dipeptidase [Sphingobacterium composti Yoo et al. 2007 non Ten et al. 2007]TYP98626.1 acetylornithine deacetylase/succinyl-diaminopimelate desuccinylase-like protein [Sphingobacterium composti Yoo et al. 2007 non Ten et al. 2007]
MQTIKEYVQSNKDRFLEELFALLRFPSISADPKYKEDVVKTAEFVAERLKEAGADNVEVCPTAGNPIVYGEKIVDASLPTVLVYGHYDVQPADPLELWETPPFEPTVRDGKIYARGAADDKGQFYMHVKAFEYMMRNNALACNVKFMIEGEEEVGSANLETFVKANKKRLQNDVIVISDTSMISMEQPSLETGLRGLSYVEVEVTGPNRDLHSGVYGGAVANPATILAKMIASLHDENNHIAIPGFYDDVIELSAEEREALNKAPFDIETYKEDLGIGEVWGENGYTTIERTGIRPTLEVNGIWGGYIGEGAKTVLPSKAYAKISMRLVPNQNSHRITELFKTHFESIAPKYVQVQVKPHHGGEPVVTPTDSIAYKAAEKALEEAFNKKPIPTRGGGSIPIVALFEKELGVKTVLLGFGLDSDNLHSPNEKYGIENYLKGIETIPSFFKYYAELSK